MKPIGEKRVFVTKRINGKETHTKIEKKKNPVPKNKDQEKTEEKFNFSNEIIIGVNSEDAKENVAHKVNNKKKEKKRKKVNNKKKKVNKKLITAFSVIILVTAIIILALTAPIFNIVNIQVEGNDKISNEAIVNLSGLKIGENIFKFDNTIINNLKENAYIDSVKITRKLPDTVKLFIKEREIKYQINLINSYVYIDKNGYILENSTVKKDVPVIVGLQIQENELLNKQRLETLDLEKINSISKILESAKAINIEELITEINAENPSDYSLYLESKNKKIYIGDTSNLTNKMLYVQKIIQNEEGKKGIAFVNGDISSGFKPYFREET